MEELIKKIIRSKNRVLIKFPQSENIPAYFGAGELSDVLSFGFSYVEHEDYCVEYIIVGPEMAKKIVKEINDVKLMTRDYLGTLWTSKIILTDKINKDRIVFSNKDYSVVLDLNINKMEE
jgi:hypothetical protein